MDLTESIRTKVDQLRVQARTRYDEQINLLDNELKALIRQQQELWTEFELAVRQWQQQEEAKKRQEKVNGHVAVEELVVLDDDDAENLSAVFDATTTTTDSSLGQCIQLRTTLKELSVTLERTRRRIKETRVEYQLRLKRLDQLEEELTTISGKFERDAMKQLKQRIQSDEEEEEEDEYDAPVTASNKKRKRAGHDQEPPKKRGWMWPVIGVAVPALAWASTVWTEELLRYMAAGNHPPPL